MPPRNTPLWHKDCFELGVTERKRTKGEVSALLPGPRVPSRGLPRPLSHPRYDEALGRSGNTACLPSVSSCIYPLTVRHP